MYIDGPKSRLEKGIDLLCRVILGAFVAAFALLIEIGMFAHRGASFFASEYIESEAPTFVAFILSSPIY